MPTGVILLTAGQGRRFGLKRAKQLLTFDKAPLAVKSLKTFLSVPSIKEIILVVPAGQLCRYQVFQKLSKKIKLTQGGSFRGQSVKNGMKAMSSPWDVILVHDAARPLVERDVIKRVEKAAKKYEAALAAWPLSDSLKWVTGKNRVKRSIPRKQLWLAQTPQGFSQRAALRSLLFPSRSATDDVELAARKGFKPAVVLGSPKNIKVTYPFDLAICKAMLKVK